MSYTPTPYEAEVLATMLRLHGVTGEGRILADKLDPPWRDPPKVTAEEARVAIDGIVAWRQNSLREGAKEILLRFIDQHDNEANP